MARAMPVARTVAVILAAGLGTRMRSGRAKVLHPLGGLPLAAWVVRAVRPFVDRVVVVVGHERDAVREALAGEGVSFAVQEEQLGTGHALLCAEGELRGAERLLVLAGDVPRLTRASLAALLREHASRGSSATVLTFRANDPAGYGRIVRGPDGSVSAIVEHRDASEAELAIGELNSGIYALQSQAVLPLLKEAPHHGPELYLTTAVELLAASGARVSAVEVSEREAAGVNTQAQLAELQRDWHAERVRELQESGVTVVAPETLAIDVDVVVGAGTVLAPLVVLEGRTRIGERCEIGSLVRLRSVEVGPGARLSGPLALESRTVPAGATLSAFDVP